MAKKRLVATVVLLMVTSLNIGSCTRNNDPDATQKARPSAGKEGWLSLHSWCRERAGCTDDYLIKVDSLQREGEELFFKSWHNGKLYRNVLNCKDSSVYKYNLDTKQGRRSNNTEKFNPRSYDPGWEGKVGIIFCKSELRKGSGAKDIEWSGKYPLSLAGEWIRYENRIEQPSHSYEWYFNEDVDIRGGTVFYAVYAAYNPRQTIWGTLSNAILGNGPTSFKNNHEKYRYIGWRKVSCKSGDFSEFLPYTPYALSAPEITTGVWLPRQIVRPDSLSARVRSKYC